MRFIYNLAQFLLLPLLALLLPFYLLVRPEKRRSLPRRFGVGLRPLEKATKTTIWIHALSVGEVTSALPLVKQLYLERSKISTIVFSASTTSGYQLAERIIRPYSDSLIYYPYDFLPTITLFINRIKPDLFILIETDFWPNLVHCLADRQVPQLLFNGRVSEKSMDRYRRFSFFFKPLFDSFNLLCMQTADDSRKMMKLGVMPDKIKTLGNLKFADIGETDFTDSSSTSPFPPDKLIVLAGSTHQGEEEIVADAFVKLKYSHPDLHLAIAPRRVERCGEVEQLLRLKNLSINNYSKLSNQNADVTLIDTIGDLSRLYRFADISFIGGSLVPEGGHNPLEAVKYGTAVLFGPHMQDFSEISSGLLAVAGAVEVRDEAALHDALTNLIISKEERTALGQNGKQFTAGHKHIIADHIRFIDHYL